ncbi:uncharacterized protein LOC132205192 [Neocloeon triangulifer]|uniref:uncharacterized protein LOC132205192 n=1 Tax=Neocloeon triangulifer TaxID=2078957 RepID=UPI00286F06C5|nr:uncharacterized protein LOC132205192 [Neocloeon triangulifer]
MMSQANINDVSASQPLNPQPHYKTRRVAAETNRQQAKISNSDENEDQSAPSPAGTKTRLKNGTNVKNRKKDRTNQQEPQIKQVLNYFTENLPSMLQIINESQGTKETEDSTPETWKNKLKDFPWKMTSLKSAIIVLLALIFITHKCDVNKSCYVHIKIPANSAAVINFMNSLSEAVHIIKGKVNSPDSNEKVKTSGASNDSNEETSVIKWYILGDNNVEFQFEERHQREMENAYFNGEQIYAFYGPEREIFEVNFSKQSLIKKNDPFYVKRIKRRIITKGPEWNQFGPVVTDFNDEKIHKPKAADFQPPSMDDL